MNTTCVLMLISSAMLMRGTAYAAPLSPVFQPAPLESAGKTESDHPGDTSHGSSADSEKDHMHGKPDDEQPDPHQVWETAVDRNPTNLSKVKRPRQFPNPRERSASGNAMTLHHPAFCKPTSGAKGGFMQNETVKSTVPARPTSVVQPTAATLSSVRHHGPNPATIGGLGNSATSSINGSINGTRMHRRP
jgi:hypothetical protein